MKNTRQLLYLKPSQLLTHPRNMRKFYPAEQVQEMANSIAAGQGVLEPLIITADTAGKWVVVDGNMRLAGARLLGDKCPILECKVVNHSMAEQRLAMITANSVRYEVDPVSEALHFKELKDEGLSVREISRRTGVYEIRIANRLPLADLEPQIQKYIIDGKLPCGHQVATALLKLKPALRLRLAKRAAENPNLKSSTIIKACERLSQGKTEGKKLRRPATDLTGISGKKGEVTIKDLRLAAARACNKCNQFEVSLMKRQAPAWSVVAHAADEVCGGCDLKDVQKICGSCPVVELLRKLLVAKAGDDARG